MARGVRCGWCAKDITNEMQNHECAEGDEVEKMLTTLGKRIKFIGSILLREACVFGEEPLTGTLERLRDAEEALTAIVRMRDNNLQREI